MVTSIRVLRVGTGPPASAEAFDGAASRIDVTATTRASEALATVEQEPVDCVVTDFDLPETTGLEVLEGVRDRDSSLPVILYADEVPPSALQIAYTSGLTDYLRRSVDTESRDVLATRITRTVRDRVLMLDRLERLVLECNRELASADSRLEIESDLCERLTDIGAYDAAWVGRYESDTSSIDPTAAAGIEDAPDEITLPEARTDGSPLLAAVRSRTVGHATVADLERGSDRSVLGLPDPPETAESVAAVPLAFEETLYGVLVVFSDRREAFGSRERELLTELGDSVGHMFSFMDLSDRYTHLLDHVPVEAVPEAATDEEGYFERVVEDITEHQKSLQELANAKARFEALFEQSPDMIFVHDSTGDILDVNARACEKLDFDREELVEMAYPDIDPTVDAAEVRERTVSLETGESPMFDGVFQSADGTSFPVELHVTPLADIENEYLIIARDVSTRRERERKLASRSEELERQNERLAEFVDVLSHDIPNHLNAAQTRLDVARQRENYEQLEYVETAHDRIDAIIGDMKSLVKQGQAVKEFEWISLTEVARPCWKSCCGDWDNDSLLIERDGQLQADESRLKQLLENLFWNAREHAGDDVNITVGLMNAGFYVADDGAGIPPDQRETVLEPGYTSTPGEHSGFGLTLVREIAHAHDWEVTITESAAGGARFEFRGVTVEQ